MSKTSITKRVFVLIDFATYCSTKLERGRLSSYIFISREKGGIGVSSSVWFEFEKVS